LFRLGSQWLLRRQSRTILGGAVPSRDAAGGRVAYRSVSFPAVSDEFHHGHEPRAEEIALHQRFLTLLGEMEAAEAEGDDAEMRRLRPLLERPRKRWLVANLRVTRGR
jgi:hypothetical protein